MIRNLVYVIAFSSLLQILSAHDYENVNQTINEASLPKRLSPDTVYQTVLVGVTSDVAADLVVDLKSDTTWYGGGRTRVFPGTDNVVVEFPIFTPLDPDDDIYWNTFLTEPGGDWRVATQDGSDPKVVVDGSPPAPVVEDSITLLAAPTEVSLGSRVFANIGYEAVTNGRVFLEVIREAEGRRGVGFRGSVAVTAGRGTVYIAPVFSPSYSGPFSYRVFLVAENTSGSQNALAIESVFGNVTDDPDTAYMVGANEKVICEGQGLNISYSYTASEPLEMAFDIFNLDTGAYIHHQRIPVRPGTRTTTDVLGANCNLPVGRYKVNNFLVQPGGQWFDTIQWGRQMIFEVEAAP